MKVYPRVRHAQPPVVQHPTRTSWIACSIATNCPALALGPIAKLRDPYAPSKVLSLAYRYSGSLSGTHLPHAIDIIQPHTAALPYPRDRRSDITRSLLATTQLHGNAPLETHGALTNTPWPTRRAPPPLRMHAYEVRHTQGGSRKTACQQFRSTPLG